MSRDEGDRGAGRGLASPIPGPDAPGPPPTGPEGRPAGIWLVRHGETEWARDLRHTGRTDVPLTEAGRGQAADVGRRLRGIEFELVLSSPLSRALETARLAGFADVVRVDPDLAEWDYGRFEGLTTPEIGRSHPGWTIWTDGAEGGESPAQVGRRADRVIARLGGVDGRVLVFAHGHLLRVLAARWAGLPASGGRLLGLSVATVSVLGWEHGARVIDRWNEACGRGG